MIYPSNDCCTNDACLKKIPLKEYQKKIVVYTRDVGMQLAYSVHYYCPSKPMV